MCPEITKDHSAPPGTSRTTRTTFVQDEKQLEPVNCSVPTTRWSSNLPTRPSSTNQSPTRYTFEDALRYSRKNPPSLPPRPDVTEYYSSRHSCSTSPTSSMWSSGLKRMDDQSAKPRIGNDVYAPVGELSDTAALPTSFNSVRSWRSGPTSRVMSKVCLLLLLTRFK